MLIVCGSLSGAPGVSTLAVGLAARWPRPSVLLAEADPSGGVLAARFGLAQQPGLASLAAATRHGGPGVEVARHVQRLPIGVDVVLAPGSAEAAAGAVAMLAGQPDTVRHLAPAVLVDVGRVYPASPALPLLTAADAVLLLVTPSIEYLDHVDARLPELRQLLPPRFGLALTDRGDYRPEEITDRLRLPVWAQLPRDRWGAAALSGRVTGRRWTRTALARTAADLANGLATASTTAAGVRR